MYNQPPPTQPYKAAQAARKPRIPFTLKIVLLFVGTLLATPIACSVVPQLFGSLMRTIEPSCLIGVQGTSVVVQVQSWASGDCNALAFSKDNFSGADLTGLGLYPISASDTAGLTTQCEMDLSNRHVIVRSGEASLLGAKVICDKLRGLPY